MNQEKRFGKRVAMPSTLQIIRELKTLMRHDAETAQAAETAPAGIVSPEDGALYSASAISRPEAR